MHYWSTRLSYKEKSHQNHRVAMPGKRNSASVTSVPKKVNFFGNGHDSIIFLNTLGIFIATYKKGYLKIRHNKNHLNTVINWNDMGQEKSTYNW